MSRDTDKNLFIVPSMPRFYQQILKGIGNYQELGNRVIRQIETAHAFRQVERVKELAGVLINIPIKEYQLIAQYYLVWCKCRESKLHPEILQNIINKSGTYKTKALLSLAGFEGLKGNLDSELYLYTEALKSSSNVSDYVQSSMGIAVVKAKEGFHESALKDLERLISSIKYTDPIIYFDVLNSYAVELGRAGRKDEARNVIRHVVASPFAFAYPEWQETAQELKEPSRSFVVVPSIEHEPVKVEPIEAHHASEPERPSRVVPFPKLKEVPPPTKPKRVTPQEFGDMTADERAELVLATIRSGEVRESDYIKLAMSLGLLDSGPASKVIDLKDETVLDNIISVWCNMIEPEQFASVMSALRDCKDDQTRETIIDDMITIAFKQSHTSMLTEQEWRLQVERRLPKTT